MGSNMSTRKFVLSDATVTWKSKTPFNADFDGDQQNVKTEFDYGYVNYDLENLKRYEEHLPNLVG